MAPVTSLKFPVASASGSLVTRIDDFAPLYPDDDGSLAEDERTAWLLLHEGARLSIEHDVALSLAG